ncbi:hypothetical protein ACN469_32980 [Corallococcus terminator]
MLPLSCANCCFNGLQHDTIGTSFGYCVEHRKILRFAEELTCGRQFRKDLPFVSSEREHEQHSKLYSRARVAFLRERSVSPEAAGFIERDAAPLRTDAVGDAVADYGLLGAKIESLARLKQLQGVRAEIAMLSMGRSYVRRCIERNGSWTSGIHILWWTRRRLTQEPEITINDIRVELAIPLPRQIEIAQWAVLMLRLIFISDIGHHAKTANPRNSIGNLSSLAEEAAAETTNITPHALITWLKRKGLKRFDDALPEHTYIRIAKELHRNDDDPL